MGDLQDPPELPALEAPCGKCRGGGWYSYGAGDREPCPVCDGAGYEPTEFGRRVLDLVRHNIPAMLREARGVDDWLPKPE